MRSSSTIYRLDRKERIISVSGPWDRFARENGGVHIFEDEIKGRSIWEFITGDATRMWLDTLLGFARIQNEKIQRPYRCDSPDLIRYMQMTITPEENGILRTDHTLVSQQKRLNPLYTFHESTSDSKISRIRCSICGRIGNGMAWEEPHTKHTVGSNRIVVDYTVCSECNSSSPGESRHVSPGPLPMNFMS